MKRSKHNLSHYNLLTGDMGALIPVACTEVLPGDSIQASTSLLLRVSPLVAPVMHPISVRVHHWFVPNRLLWDGWEEFITGGPDGLNNETPPTITAGATGFVPGEVLDFLGVPPSVPNLEVSSMPIAAYNLIYNEHYRDQDLCVERALLDQSIARVAWEKDYFTAARPWPQKGGDVSMPLGIQAPVVRTPNAAAWEGFIENTNTWSNNDGNPITVNPQLQHTTTNQRVSLDPKGGLYADLTQATAVNVNDVRKAFALQRYQEARARYGSRYTEYLRYLGVRSSDARLQRPEYLGGGKSTISFSEVLKTGSGEDPSVPIGAMAGHGISALRSSRFRRFFEEHGIMMTLISVRPKSMYTQGLNRQWLRRNKEDYWQKELEHIGQQEVLSQEVYAGAAADTVFGYNDRYAEYRSQPNRVSAEFRDEMDYWHLARTFAAEPVLNASFVNCDPGKRIHAIQTNHVLWIMAQNHIVARRLVSSSAAPRLY